VRHVIEFTSLGVDQSEARESFIALRADGVGDKRDELIDRLSTLPVLAIEVCGKDYFCSHSLPFP